MEKTKEIVHFFKSSLFVDRSPNVLLFSVFLALLIGSITLVGCATVVLDKEGMTIEEKNIKRILPGSTTRGEVIEAFGKPMQSIAKASGREELFFEHKVNEAPTYLWGLVIDKKRVREQKSTLRVIIKDNIVESYRYEREEEK